MSLRTVWLIPVIAVWILAVPIPVRVAERPAAIPPETLSLDSAVAEAAKLSRLRSLLVSWHGELVLERYFNGTRPERVANIKSASKSVLSALVGIAIGRGDIPDVRQSIADYFPELKTDPVRQRITIEDLLTMRSGLDSTSNRNYGAWVSSSNWVRYVLTRPIMAPPGTSMIYSTGNTHLLSAILTRVTKKSTWQFAQDNLARPMGFSLPQWPRDPQGIYFGGNDMALTPRQMLAFGKMYLDGGRVGDKQIVPAGWVETSLAARAISRRERDRFYGYGWWVRELAGYPTQYAWGYGGQFIFLVPDLELVIAVTSSSEPGMERRSHLNAIYDIVEYSIIPAVSRATAP